MIWKKRRRRHNKPHRQRSSADAVVTGEGGESFSGSIVVSDRSTTTSGARVQTMRPSPNCRYQTEYKVRDYEFLSRPDVKEPVRDHVFLSGPDVNGRVRDYEVLDDIIREEFSRAYKVLKSRTPQIDTETQLDEEEVDRLRGNHARYRMKACLVSHTAMLPPIFVSIYLPIIYNKKNSMLWRNSVALKIRYIEWLYIDFI